MTTTEKYYAMDLGLRNIVKSSEKMDTSKLYENPALKHSHLCIESYSFYLCTFFMQEKYFTIVTFGLTMRRNKTVKCKACV